ncbi:Pentatricopeptide repeat-containing protein At4g22760 [Linum perenne]
MIISRLHYLEPLLIRQILSSVSSYSTILAQYVQGILRSSRNPDAFSWSCTIRYFSQEGQFKDAFCLYVELLRVGLCPSTFALSSTLRACGRISYATAGRSIHAQAYKYGFGGCVYVQTALVDLYSKLGDMDTAQKAFDDTIDKNVVSWNSILSGYLKSGNLDEAKRVFDQIPEKDVVSWNSMLSGYAKAGSMDQASTMFQQMPEKNYASWNAMISGLVDCGEVETARSYFDKMPNRYIQPDKITLVSVISACSQLGDMTFGSWIESYIRNAGIDRDDQLNTALIDLYAKCGNIQKADELFNSLNKKDMVAYSAMISGFGMNGKINEAIKLFEAMEEAQIPPNLATYTGLLSAYCHAGMVEEGYKCFHVMKDHDLAPSVDHYAIMVDLLGRAGRVEEAYEMIKSMPMQPHAGVWGALLLACKVHNNVEYGEIAAKHCFELEPNTTAYYSLLASIYASAGKWADVRSLRKSVNEKQLGSLPGTSWMESTT